MPESTLARIASRQLNTQQGLNLSNDHTFENYRIEQLNANFQEWTSFYKLLFDTLSRMNIICPIFHALGHLLAQVTPSYFFFLEWFWFQRSIMSIGALFSLPSFSAQFTGLFVIGKQWLNFLKRFIGTFLLTGILNQVRPKKIPIQEQFIMAYGGLRGAVGFSLGRIH